jgi:hypothetical protein
MNCMTANTATPDDERRSPTQERAEALRRSAAEAGRKSASFLQPRVSQAWNNLRIWLPFFDTPNRRARQVRYAPNDCRTGLSWEVPLPKQCCECGRTDALTSERFEIPVRAFDFPLHIAGVSGLMSVGILFLAFLAFSFGAYTALLILLSFAALIWAIAAGLLFLKSWEEDVRLRLYACPDHAEKLTAPDLVVHDNELTVVLGSESLAEAANAELKQQRRGRQRDVAEKSGAYRPASQAPGAPPAAIPVGPPPVPRRPVVEDLPPIKLAGDDEDLLP